MGLVNDRRASTDLELTSGGLVGATGFKVDSTWWNSLQSDNELKLKKCQPSIYICSFHSICYILHFKTYQRHNKRTEIVICQPARERKISRQEAKGLYATLLHLFKVKITKRKATSLSLRN